MSSCSGGVSPRARGFRCEPDRLGKAPSACNVGSKSGCQDDLRRQCGSNREPRGGVHLRTGDRVCAMTSGTIEIRGERSAARSGAARIERCGCAARGSEIRSRCAASSICTRHHLHGRRWWRAATVSVTRWQAWSPTWDFGAAGGVWCRRRVIRPRCCARAGAANTARPEPVSVGSTPRFGARLTDDTPAGAGRDAGRSVPRAWSWMSQRCRSCARRRTKRPA